MSPQYLTTRIIHPLWPMAADVIANQVLHGIRGDAAAQGWKVLSSSMDMAALPAFSESGSALVFRLPATGAYQFSAELKKPKTMLPDLKVTIKARLSVEMTIGAGEPVTDVTAKVDMALSHAPDVFLDGFESDLKKRIVAGIQEHLGFFRTLRCGDAGLADVPTPRLIRGLPELGVGQAVDIALLSDGFTADDMPAFREIAGAVEGALLGETPGHGSEPFCSFDSVIRLWTLEAPCLDPNEPLQRVAQVYADAATGTRKTALSNLARLSALGQAAEAADLLVVMTRRTGASGRAVAMGRVVMLPVSPETAAQDVRTLVHELGHTIIANLGDEYDGGFAQSYLGNEPASPNVTASVNATLQPPLAPKWSKWDARTGLPVPEWDVLDVHAHEGAWDFQKGLYRPASNCRMRSGSDDVPFCRVCREALTLGLRGLLSSETLVVECRYVDLNLTHRISGTGGRCLPVLEGGATAVEVRLVASTLPKPWHVNYQWVPGPGPHPIVPPASGDNVFRLQVGDALRISLSSGCIFTPGRPIPELHLELGCDRPLRQVPEAPPTVPTDLQATALPWHGQKQQAHVRLQASARDPNADDVKFVFEVVKRAEPFTGVPTAQTAYKPWVPGADDVVTGAVEVALTDGEYRVRAMAVDSTRKASNWSPPKTFRARC